MMFNVTATSCDVNNTQDVELPYIITWWKYCKCKESTEREMKLHLKLDQGNQKKEVTILHIYPLHIPFIPPHTLK